MPRGLDTWTLALTLLGGSVTCLPAAAEEEEGGRDGPPAFTSSWASLERYTCPEWFRDAKLGIYVHWGVYSLAGKGCWYGRHMYSERRPEYAHHVERFGHPSKVGYRDLIPLWKAERFDPDAWLAAFRDAGARYFTPCAVHHDGFDLWDSPHRFNSVAMGPRRNVIAELRAATLRHGLRWGVTTHFARNYNFFQTGYGADSSGPRRGVRYISDTPENRAFYHPPHGDTNPKYPRAPSGAWKRSWSTRMLDLIDRYDPDFLYLDGALPFDDDDGLTGREVLARFYGRGRERHGGKDRVVMTIKTARGGHGIYREGVATLDLERHRLKGIRPRPWQTDDTIGVRRWSHEEGMAYRPVDELIDEFVDIVSKNGNLLLNVPPRADGTLDPETLRILAEIGRWNRTHGEAVFATRPWLRFGEGKGVRFTRSKDGCRLYVLVFDWPPGGRLTVEALRSGAEATGDAEVRSVALLGSERAVGHRRDARGLHLEIPERTSEHAVAVRVEWDRSVAAVR